MQKILITNDDGISAVGIARLAKYAKKFGDVTVIAPKRQCSAMSHRITLGPDIEVREYEQFEVAGVKAYVVDGTPADCVKIGMNVIMKDGVDVVFSGINAGYNSGRDIQYSGTVAAALEASEFGVKAIAFSENFENKSEVTDEYIYDVIEKILDKPLAKNKIWNVNFPGCSLSECKGIKWDCFIDDSAFYLDHYDVEEKENGSTIVRMNGVYNEECTKGSDFYAVVNNYISIGEVTNVR